MQALRVIQQVAEDGYLHVRMPDGIGKKFELIILPLDEKENYRDTQNYMKMQEESGFIKTVVASPEEDIWNDV
jgi:hypothetical protein